MRVMALVKRAKALFMSGPQSEVVRGAWRLRRRSADLNMPDLGTTSLAYLSKIAEDVLMTSLSLFLSSFEIIIIIFQRGWRSIVEQALKAY